LLLGTAGLRLNIRRNDNGYEQERSYFTIHQDLEGAAQVHLAVCQ
jgi:hypothetical protein